MVDLIARTVSAVVPHARAVSYNLSVPGNIAPSGSLADPAGIIVNLYQFGMLVAGILAFGMVVWAGVQYSWARGNPTGQADARDRILQAFLGILLLVGAYAILYTLNPGLTRLQLPVLSPVDPKATVPQKPPGYDPNVDLSGVDLGGGSGPATKGLRATGGCAANMSNCQKIPATGGGVTCNAANNACYIDQNLARIVNCARDNLTAQGVTPPTLSMVAGYSVTSQYHTGSKTHCDQRHYTGCAADFVFTRAPSSCAQVNAFNAELKKCGGVTYNEYVVNGVRCGEDVHSYGNNIHVAGCNNTTQPALPPNYDAECRKKK